MGVDIKVAKDAAHGHWARIANSVIGISDDHLTTVHGPCPKCGGTDRWRVFEDFDETGGALCNQCGKFGDGFALAQHFLNVPFFEAVELVCKFLGVEDKKPKRSKSKPAPTKLSRTKEEPKAEATRDFSELEFIDWRPRLFDTWSATKQPITEEAVKLAGGRFARYRGMTVIALPITGRDGTPSGYAVYNATGNPIPYRPKGSDEVQQLKVKIVGAKNESGWIGRFLPGEVTIKAEGVSDTLAILSANPKASVICNPFGASENPLHKDHQWMLQQLRGETVWTIHDRDLPGLAGATWVEQSSGKKRPGWSTAIAIVAKESRNIELPFELVEAHGKDSRDFLMDHTFEDLAELAKNSPIVPKPEGYSIENAEVDEEIERHHIDDPHRLAKLNLEKYQVEYGRTLKYWNQTWYRYRDGVYLEMTNDHLIARINSSIKEEFDRAWESEYAKYKAWRKSKDYDSTNDKGPPKVRKVKSSLVADVYAATKGMCTLGSGQRMHDWIDEESAKANQGICISTDNGILNITKAISATEIPREEILLPHTPNWFSTSKLSFEFDEHAQCPNWLKFLSDVFSDNEESIDVLQKWFGYLLTPDNSLQKILFVIGEKRSGKGTVVQVMRNLFGDTNVATPKLTDFSRDFALQPLANKTVALITDARLTKRADETMITETLLAISGGDPQDISRKYKETLSAYEMKCRFTIFSNLIPNLRDLSAAFISRCIFLRMPNSYLGREDFGLLDRLKPELPGILNWAILGRHKLNQEPRLIQPKSGQALINEIKSLTSPLLEFLEGDCIFGDESFEVDTKELYGYWEEWCKENDVEHPGSVQSFSRKLKAIKPNVEVRQYRLGATRSRKFVGIRPSDSLTGGF